VPLDVPGFGGWSPERWTQVDFAGVCARTR
jgi:hypothetical protein